jgi:putative ABC transport system ATP-binding protein
MTATLSPPLAIAEDHVSRDARELPAVECRQLTKDFGDGDSVVHALRGIDMEIERGAMTLVVGPSGCGKTTLLSVMAGLLNPTAGRILVLGQDLELLSDRELCEFRARHVGFVFQQYNLISALTAAENAAIPLVILGESLEAGAETARSVLSEMGMETRANAYPRQLSGGEQQRVAIARALANEPQLLVCDEPTSSLDAEAGQHVMKLFRDVAVQPGRGVIVVTHDNRVLDWGDRIVRKQDGRISSDERRGGGKL